MDASFWMQRYAQVRAETMSLTEPLTIEDQVIQTEPFVSPTKWHLAHTTWFFETFLLTSNLPDYAPFDPAFAYLFNSYYNTVGPQFSRSARGLLSRPGVARIRDYRAHVDAHMARLLSSHATPEIEALVEVGLHHEQQHQELLITDIKHVLAFNPLHPVYREEASTPEASTIASLGWISLSEGVVEIGHEGDDFCFDNERPRHKTYLHAAALGDRLVTNAEYLEFIDDGGYETASLWLDDGWHTVQAQGWQAPGYWESREGAWHHMTLSGFRPVRHDEPVTHISFYEADAFARWAGARLPTEAEWEIASRQASPDGANFVESARFHPVPPSRPGHTQMYGDVWEWTASPYVGYPGYRAPQGALGEYNGKFMCNTIVLRGGSCATSATHIRATYRNFFAPPTRWQFCGLRLARDLT